MNVLHEGYKWRYRAVAEILAWLGMYVFAQTVMIWAGEEKTRAEKLNYRI